MSDFEFDPSSHVYKRAGRVVPGCTRILGHTGLADYRWVRAEILERTSNLGRRVASYTHFFDENDIDWSDLTDEERARVEAWAEFRVLTGFVPRLCEHQMVAEVDGMAFGMQLDREGIINRSPAIVEIKCTRQIMWHHGIQTAGYAAGLPMEGVMSPMARFLRRRRYVVQLLPTGKPVMREFTDGHDYHTFHSALYLTHQKMSHGMKLQDLSKIPEEETVNGQ